MNIRNRFKQFKLWLKILIVSLALFYCAACYLFAAAVAFDLSGKPRTLSLQRIENNLGLEIPAEVNNLEYDSSLGYGGFISFSFNASPEIMEAFVQNICDGELHQGYDPFNAINTTIPVDNSYLIDLGDPISRYYSHSPNTPETTFGNRCWDEQMGMIEVVLDTIEEDTYSLTYLQSTSGDYDIKR